MIILDMRSVDIYIRLVCAIRVQYTVPCILRGTRMWEPSYSLLLLSPAGVEVGSGPVSSECLSTPPRPGWAPVSDSPPATTAVPGSCYEG